MSERFPVATESEIVNPATMPFQVMTADDRVREAFYFIFPKGAFFHSFQFIPALCHPGATDLGQIAKHMFSSQSTGKTT